jgi:antitoxin VapB
MGLNIKNERVHELARQAARVTGKSQTGAIEEALERLLLAYDQDPEQARIATKVDLVHGFVAAYVADPGDAEREIATVEDLYDEATGLPR